MASTPQQDLRKVSVGRSRPTAAAIQTTASPHTPLSRSVSSLYGSPTASFRIEEENLLIFEFGARCMRAGFAGESSPRCAIAYSPERQRRAGDYRRWVPGYGSRPRKRKRGQDWGKDHELWRMNVEEADLGLVEDKVERLLRDVEHQHLMLDNRQKRVSLVVSSLLPKPLLSTLLGTIFSALQASSIALLPSSVMAAVGAGVRSALIVDIGWEETAVSAVYEHREVMQWRSVRAGRLLIDTFAKVLDQSTEQALGFDDVEEIMRRMGWCRQRENNPQSTSPNSAETVNIPLPTINLKVPFASLAEPVEDALFARGTTASDLDDHDQPLPLLMYNALLHLPIDVRRLCVSRVILTGGISNLAGLKRRLTQELEALVQTRGWDPVKNYGSAQGKRGEHKVLRERNTNAQRPKTEAEAKTVRFLSTDEQVLKVSETTDEPPRDAPTNIPARAREPETDPIIAKLNQQVLQSQGGEQVSGVVRAVDTLGAWAGASLLTTLRVRGIVEIEKDKFLQHGLAGASTKKDISVAQQRQSLGPGVRPGAGERSSWTLGIWT